MEIRRKNAEIYMKFIEKKTIRISTNYLFNTTVLNFVTYFDFNYYWFYFITDFEYKDIWEIVNEKFSLPQLISSDIFII